MPSDAAMLWEVDVYDKPGFPDREGGHVLAEARDSGVQGLVAIRSARGFLLEGDLDRPAVDRIARELLADPVIEDWVAFQVLSADELNQAEQQAVGGLSDDEKTIQATYTSISHSALQHFASRFSLPGHPVDLIQILRKPGVMDPVALSCEKAIRDLGIKQIGRVRTLRKYWVHSSGDPQELALLTRRVLANDSIEQVIYGELALDHLDIGAPYDFRLMTIPLREMDDRALETLSREGQLSLSLREMQAIQDHFCRLGRDPTDAELETIAQTWSEHCSHKTLKGPIDYEERDGEGHTVRRMRFYSLLKETVFAATQEIRQNLGAHRDWCVSVFEDNAGIVRFDDQFNVCFKVETHNHPSAIEPYGGANTGIGGVIRDVLGTGLGARPVANTDVFCFAPPDVSFDELPPGVLHPKRVMKGVVAGVRDYGNRMGIPTLSGAIYFDPCYLANPLVYCGTVGVIPIDKCQKGARPGDLIVAVGGRTGRDGIHGATFSSAELTQQSEEVSGGAVQIGNAITEKMMLDVILKARDQGLCTAITDCGAGGFSSAVGEMGARVGAEVWLERAPLKYEGLSYTEIWISESQERMVLAVPPENWEALHQLCDSEDVEATVIGQFQSTGRLVLKYDGHVVADLEMEFLHQGRPTVVRQAVYQLGEPGASASGSIRQERSQDLTVPAHQTDYTDDLKRILASLNVCSKEWVIRQYDHEVQGGSVIKPLVGVDEDGPSDAAVIRPRLDSHRGLAIACGMNPRYGDLDPYWMAAGAIDEAVRNCVAVGADPRRIALLDNFCWGNTDRPEVLGSLVRAALACRDIAAAYGTPFISGKDSLNNEFTYQRDGSAVTITVPPSLLISAIGQIDDVRRSVTMDLKEPGNLLFLIGVTKEELGGSHYALVNGLEGGQVPTVDPPLAVAIFERLHEAIRGGFVRSSHDLSEGGLAVALAEMAFAGNLGAGIDLHAHEGRDSAEKPPEVPQARTADLGDAHAAKGPRGPAAHARSRRRAITACPTGEVVRILFSESHSRFLVEVRPDREEEFVELMQGPVSREGAHVRVPVQRLGRVTNDGCLTITNGRPSLGERDDHVIVRAPVDDLKKCWQRPLRWSE